MILPRSRLGPIELEILRSALTAVAAEMDVTVWRTSRSTIAGPRISTERAPARQTSVSRQAPERKTDRPGIEPPPLFRRPRIVSCRGMRPMALALKVTISTRSFRLA